MTSKYYPSLDGLRGIAAILVVFSHYAGDIDFFVELEGVASTGFIIGAIGVMMFFALSGFLMMHVTHQLDFNRSNVWVYFVNRFSRVLPLYWFILIFTCTYQIFFSDILGVSQSNLAFSGFSDTVEAFVEHLFLARGDSVYWTISVEILFYLLFPIIWFTTKSGERLKVLILLILVTVAIQVATDFQYRRTPAHSRLNTTVQFFLLGSLIYTLLTREPLKENTQSLLMKIPLSALALANVALLFPFFRTLLLGDAYWISNAIEIYSTDISFVLAVGITLLAVTKFKLFETFLSSSLMRYLGRISFSIYLTHRFIVAIAIPMQLSEYSRSMQLGAFVFGFLPVVIAISALSYRFVECPSQKMIRQQFS